MTDELKRAAERVRNLRLEDGFEVRAILNLWFADEDAVERSCHAIAAAARAETWRDIGEAPAYAPRYGIVLGCHGPGDDWNEDTFGYGTALAPHVGRYTHFRLNPAPPPKPEDV